MFRVRFGCSAMFAVGLILVTPACALSDASSVHSVQAAPQTAALTTHDLYTSMFAISPSERAERAAAAGSISLRDYYQAMLATSTNAAFVVDGRTLAHAHDWLHRSEKDYLALDASFASLDAYWQAVHFDPVAAISEADFAAALQRRLARFSTAAAALALDAPADATSELPGFPPLPKNAGKNYADIPGSSATQPSQGPAARGFDPYNDLPTDDCDPNAPAFQRYSRNLNAALAGSPTLDDVATGDRVTWAVLLSGFLKKTNSGDETTFTFTQFLPKPGTKGIAKLKYTFRGRTQVCERSLSLD